MSSNKVALKFIYSEKATKFCEIFPLLIDLLLSYIVPVKSKVKISQNFVAFSEYMNFIKLTNSPPVRISPHCVPIRSSASQFEGFKEDQFFFFISSDTGMAESQQI